MTPWAHLVIQQGMNWERDANSNYGKNPSGTTARIHSTSIRIVASVPADVIHMALDMSLILGGHGVKVGRRHWRAIRRGIDGPSHINHSACRLTLHEERRTSTLPVYNTLNFGGLRGHDKLPIEKSVWLRGLRYALAVPCCCRTLC